MPGDAPLVNYLPIVSTAVAAAFTVVLRRHWQWNRSARYVMWWMIGVALFGVGTLTEAATTVFGWHEWLFRSWYISGALLGGAPLAQGTVYLLARKRTADRLTVILSTYVVIAASFVISTPIDRSVVEGDRLSGKVMEWGWVRLFSPLLNTYALIFLVGGAIVSAWRYSRRPDRPHSRVKGNVLIAVGALLPGIGGSFTRLGYVEVLYVTELVGLTLIWLGYNVIARDRIDSVDSPPRILQPS
jgi:drug/metabolite transporter (DMT)-like permease